MIDNSFFEKFNNLTQNKYDFLRINEILVDKEERLINITFLLPVEKYSVVLEEINCQEIKNACFEILPNLFRKEIKFTKSILDEDICRRYVKKFFAEKYKALIGQIDENNIQIKIIDKKINISIPAFDYICKFCKQINLEEKLEAYLNSCYCGENKVSFFASGNIDTSSILEREKEIFYVDTFKINVEVKEALIGKGIFEKPKYISKFSKPLENICVCGIIQNFERHISKSKGRIFYTFELEDTTGTMQCARFTTGVKHGCLDCLENGTTVIATGRFEEDTYKASGFKLFVDKMNLCSIDFLELKERQENLKKLQKVKTKSIPQLFVDTREKNLLELNQIPCKFLKENNFVVFDLETTGLSSATDKIIEIGAIKLQDGEITTFYSTYIDPDMHIPESATRINNITDEMVADAPYIEDVIDDFYQFSQGCYMVAHNASFDTGFIKHEYNKCGLQMENPVIDTMRLAKEVEPTLPKLNLGFLCKHFKIELLNAHRAYFDAEATAQLLIKLLNKKYKQET